MFRSVTRGQVLTDIGTAVAFALVFGLGGLYFSDQLALLGVLFAVPLAVRRWSPALALILAWVAAIIQMVMFQPAQPVDVAILVVLYSTARYGDRALRYIGLASAVVGALVATIYTAFTTGLLSSLLLSLPEWLAASIILFFGSVAAFAVLGLSWAGGLLVRTRALAAQARVAEAVAQQEQVRSEEQLAVLEERHRIARDMHDVVAHSLAVIIAQADGARYAAAKQPEVAAEALTTISSTAREALADVRILLGQLRYSQGEAPQPGLADVDRLVAQLRGSGLDVQLTGNTCTPEALGNSEASAAVQLVAYRVLQEGLTNALRHGTGSSATIAAIDEAPEAMVVRVDSPSVGESVDSAPILLRPGHGLSGMAERVGLAGGELSVVRDGGRFVVTATIPHQAKRDVS